MIEYLLLLLFNSLFITGLFTALQDGHLLHGIGTAIDNILSDKIHPDKVDEIKAKGLWARSVYISQAGDGYKNELNYAYYPIWKPIKGCYVCMASLWGTIFFIYSHLPTFDGWPFELTWNILWVLPVYLISLIAVNRLIGRWMDL